MKAHAILTLLVGVASLRVVATLAKIDKLKNDSNKNEPMVDVEEFVGKRRVETPEVVLQLKYESGELNRIYLAQFRKDKESWAPSVPAKNNLCADLCHSGLGGSTCGPSCSDMLPVGLKTALAESNGTEHSYGQPRVSVCPTLCHYHLGQPLCSCAMDERSTSVDWTDVCASFCLTDGYVVGGCPPCEETVTKVPVQVTATRILDTSEGWAAWCNAQCRQGHGGAACNCDRSAFQ